MSSILKALRKLEEEKAVLGDATVDLSRDILKRSARKADSNNFWPLLSAVLFLLLIGSGVFFWSNRTASVALTNPTPPTPIAIIVQPPPKETLVEKAEVRLAKKVQLPPMSAAEVAPVEKIVLPAQVQVEPEALRPNGAPFLKLTGIAYREKSVERIAIINDLPVMQGTVIEGVQLIEILPDRAILSWRGALFNLQLEGEQ